MISLNKPTDDILHFKKRIEDKIEHAYLGRYIQKPVIDEDKLFILLKTIPENNSISHQQRDTRIITAMLVQIALDTHDLVPVENEEDETREHLLNKQLQVLAGDYYSGLYYYLLSNMNDIAFIHRLAVVIKEINEAKMKLYYNEFQTSQEYMNLKVHLESLLISRISEVEADSTIGVLIREWFYIKQLINEKKLEQSINHRIANFIKVLDKIASEEPDWKEYFTGRISELHYFITSIAKEG